MMLSRSAILHTAHDWARQAIRQDGFRHPHGRRWPSYRAALADALRSAWAVAKAQAAQAERAAAFAAEEEVEAAAIPAATVARIADLRAFAETMPFTSAGHERRRALMAQADDLAAAARCAIINRSHHHHAHAR